MKFQSYLNSFVNFESSLDRAKSQDFNLDRMYCLLKALGNPEKSLKIVHVAGTKAKGSTCVFIAHILQAAGYRVGLYTSPHLYRVNERIRVLSSSVTKDQDFCGAVSNQAFDALINKYRLVIDSVRLKQKSMSLTYFEALTALALCYFAEQKTEVVILETGLGGRLDATNAVHAIVNVITPISIDHVKLLGKTLKAIAAEKAAIIKSPSSKVIVGLQPREAWRVIDARCKQLGIRPVRIGRQIKVEQVSCAISGQKFKVRTRQHDYNNLSTSLIGRHQAYNAATAIGAMEVLAETGFSIPKKAVIQGIRETRWPGRFEVVSKNPTVIVDCAHNEASALTLAKTVRECFGRQKIILILGLSRDKDIPSICRILARLAKTVILTRSSHARSYAFEQKDVKNFLKNQKMIMTENTQSAWNQVQSLARANDIVLAAGSVFVAAEIRNRGRHVSD